MEKTASNEKVKRIILNQTLITAVYIALCLIEYVVLPLILPIELGPVVQSHLLYSVLSLIVLAKYGTAYLIAPIMIYHLTLFIITVSSKKLGWWWAVHSERPYLLRDNDTKEINKGIFAWVVASYIALFVLYLFIKRSRSYQAITDTAGQASVKRSEKGIMWGKIIVNLFVHFAGFVFIALIGFAGAGNDSYKQWIVPLALACNIPTVIGFFVKPLKDKANIAILLAYVSGFSIVSIIIPMKW